MRTHVAALVALLIAAPARAEYGHDDVEEAAKQEENPLSGIVNLRIRNNTSYLIGPYERTQDVLQLRPTLPLRLSSSLTLNTLLIVPLVWNPDSATPHDSAFGLGDISLELPVTLRLHEIFFIGLGPLMVFPTATDNRLGGSDSGKLSLGPSFQVDITPGHWVIGLIVDNVWSVAGRDSGRTVQQLTLRPTVTFNLPLGYYLITSMHVVADWTAPVEERWLVPWGGGVGAAKLFKDRIGISYEVQAFWNAVRPDGAALWQLRFQMSLFFPRLAPRS